jgi:23S rRNA pseudouridine2605 synthase/16S rRNA pseudouridine516 synthase
VSKTYIARVEGTVLPATIQQLQQGVELDDGFIVADKARLMETSQGSSMVEITLHSGRNRIVRRMLDAVGHPVEELVRRSFGPINLGTLPAGKMRDLTGVELGQILTIARQHGATVPALGGDEPEQTED